MTVDEVMQYRRAEPFRPFAIKLKDGRRFVVKNPMHIGRDVAFTRLNVAADDESFETFEGSAVARVTLLRSSKSAGARNGGRRK